MTANSAAVVVPSCDAYSDVWHPFFTFFRHNWPDCPYPLYLVSNHLRFEAPGVRALTVGRDVSWSDNLRAALESVKENYILLFIDDLLIVRRVSTQRIGQAVAWLEARQGNYLRLNGFPPPERLISPDFGVVAKGSLYRTATVASVWRKQVLAELLAPGESAWDFETRGSWRSDAYDDFYSTRRPVIFVMNAIIKGKWRRSAQRRLTEMGIPNQCSTRPMMTITEELTFRAQLLSNRALYLAPPAWRRRLRDNILATFRGHQ